MFNDSFLSKLLPAHTLPFRIEPLTGSRVDDIRYANSINKFRSIAVVSGHYAGGKGINFVVDQALKNVDKIFPSPNKNLSQ